MPTVISSCNGDTRWLQDGACSFAFRNVAPLPGCRIVTKPALLKPAKGKAELAADTLFIALLLAPGVAQNAGAGGSRGSNGNPLTGIRRMASF